MSVLCKWFGHKPSMQRIQRDPTTFAAFSVCTRCGVPLKQEAGKWSESASPGQG